MASMLISESVFDSQHTLTCFTLELPNGSVEVYTCVETPDGVFVEDHEKTLTILSMRNIKPAHRIKRIQFD